MLNSHTADALPAHTFQPMPEKNRHRLPLHSGAGIAEEAKPAFVFNAISLRSVKWQSHRRKA
jgi:hypothetical protein